MNKLRELTRKQVIVCFAVATVIVAAAAFAVYKLDCRHTYPAELVAVDSLCDSRPDSASVLLGRLPAAKYGSGADRMYYTLLKIKAANNLYRPQKDSTIFRIVDYFENHGDRDKQREAYYYLGKYYVEHNDAPYALKCFHTALDLSDDKTPLSFKSKVYSQSGELFIDQDMFDDALAMYRKSFACDSILKDTVNMIYGMKDIAQVYKFQNRLRECESMLTKAYRLSVKTGDRLLTQSVALVLSSTYLKMNDVERAKSTLRELQDCEDEGLLSPIYCQKADICDREDNADSVYFYCKKLMSVGTVYAKEYASMKLAEYYAAHSDYKNTLHYLDVYKQWANSVHELYETKNLAVAHSLYNYNQKDKEIYRLKLEMAEKTAFFTKVSHTHKMG